MIKFNFNRFLIIVLFIALAAASIAASPIPAQEAGGEKKEISIDSWLVAGPFPSPLPAFSAGGSRAFSLGDLLKFDPVDIAALMPREGDPFPWMDARASSWTRRESGEKGVELAAAGTTPETALLAAYLTVIQWAEVKLTVTSPHPAQAFLDGKSVAVKAASDKKQNSGPPGPSLQATADLKLEAGRHLLVLKTLRDPQNASAWTVRAGLSAGDAASGPAVIPSPQAADRMSMKHLLNTPRVASVSLSDDGVLAALSMSCTPLSGEESEAWLELYDTETARHVATYRGGTSISSLRWVPGRRIFSYVSRDKSESTLWLADLEQGTVRPLLEKIKNLGNHTWSPDASFLIYSLSEEPEKDPEGIRRFQNLADRQPNWRRRSYLYKLKIPELTRQRVTAGELSTGLTVISPDGKSLILGRTVIDYSRRPYSQTELCLVDLATLETTPLWKGPWFSGAEWSPDGLSLLVLGGPSAFDGLGAKVPKGSIPNDYDTQAFLFDLASKKITPLTRDFNPSIQDAVWSPDSRSLYFTVTDKSFVRLYQYALETKAFSPIDCGRDIIGNYSLARKKSLAGFIGSGPNDPPKAYLLDLEKKSVRLLRDPGLEAYADVKFGRVEPWPFKNKRGREIEGLIYYPPDFDPAKTYPCIVNYYGGTTPISRDFGGRYPKEYYAALGYVVYVLQPSGAIGYGQDFSALHVNDWGIVVADEIIDGVKKFLAAHPFVDSRKVGCIGASYGGFMTMLLVTRTDIFAAAVSHAGISSISSYWGEGYWGYGYNAVAAAESFPWNRKDIYVNQSPLFHADRIKTPLLLLHGSSDTNVPSGESTQMFTALKLLGREVEYIQVLDQDHHILDHNKRLAWSRTIMAWFDRWLKGQAAWWNDQYGSK